MQKTIQKLPGLPEGFPASKTKILNLSAIITKADSGLEDFTVNFRVWDKRANT